jgi:hypothetical protein
VVADNRLELRVVLQEAIGLLAEMEGALAALVARLIQLEHAINQG